jgi:hypothetical protein
MNFKKGKSATEKVAEAISERLNKKPMKDGLDLSKLAEDLAKRKEKVEAEEASDE